MNVPNHFNSRYVQIHCNVFDKVVDDLETQVFKLPFSECTSFLASSARNAQRSLETIPRRTMFSTPLWRCRSTTHSRPAIVNHLFKHARMINLVN